MTPEQIQKMAEGFPPSSIGKDHEEVIVWLAEQHVALQEQVQKLAALAEERRVFIVNGAEMGYIQLPVLDGDPVTATYQRCLLKPKFAADAVIREIGAKAVDGFISHCQYQLNAGNYTKAERDKFKGGIDTAAPYAAQLRAGEVS
ncbi:hypothetical protein AAH446_16270 [Erwinia sp. P6884]|uniref:hypothetical protein n=1 Tax=Erwinia sp. P6884 TaxID=3141450 RepID=UPI00318C207C